MKYGKGYLSFFQYNLCQLQFTLEFCRHAFREIPFKRVLGKGKIHLQKVLTVNQGKWSQWWQCWLNLEFSFHGDTQHHQHVYHTQGSRQTRSSEKAGISGQPAFFCILGYHLQKSPTFFTDRIWGSPHPTPSQLQWHQFGRFCKSSISPRDAHHSVASGPLFPQRRLLIDK